MGTGKTYSTSRVIDWVEKGLETNANDEAFAYFYCNKQDHNRSEPKAILRSIIRQLASGPRKCLPTNTVVHKTVYNLWLNDRDQGILSTFAQWEDCLLELVETYPRTTIVLDALDECNIEQRKGLINLLVRLTNRGAGTTAVKVFVAARPEDDISRDLQRSHLIQMQGQNNAEDIACFVRTKLAEHPRWPKLSHDFQNELVEKLVEKSGDMFLLASLQIQRLLECNTQIALRNRLATLPDSLKAAYEEILQGATSDPDERKLIVRALQWVMCSVKALTTKDLLFAVSQDSESDRIEPVMEDLDEELMLKWTRNLLHLEVFHSSRFDGLSSDSSSGSSSGSSCDNSFDPSIHKSSEHSLPGGSSVYNSSSDLGALSSYGDSDDSLQGPSRVWRMAHQAVAEFLKDSTWCNSGRAHCEVGKVCLAILLNTFHGDPPEPESDTYRASGLELQPMEAYAVYAWPTHVRAQEDRTGPDVDELSHRLQMFLGRPEDGTSAYKLWQLSLDHHPNFSVFYDRYVTGEDISFLARGELLGVRSQISPMVLACDLGIYTPLSEWWCSSTFEPNQSLCCKAWYPHHAGRILDPGLNYQWSLLALACVHGETKIINHLLGRRVRINTNDEDEVPPVVAAVMADSVKTTKELIERGADMCSPFTVRHGHLLRLAIRYNSLDVMMFLIQHLMMSPPQLAEALSSVKYLDFVSKDEIELLIDQGVDVNTHLRVGTLLLVAAKKGWESTVCRLLDKGAEVNPQGDLGRYRSVLEAHLDDVTDYSTATPSTATILVEHGAQVSGRALTLAWDHGRGARQRRQWKQVVHLFLGRRPDLNDTWKGRSNWSDQMFGYPLIDEPKDYWSDGRETSALIEAVKEGNVDRVRFLIAHGADATLRVGEEGDNALSWVFMNTEEMISLDLSKAFQIMEAILEGGASLDDLDRSRLPAALASAAFVGSEHLVRCFLGRGADPYARWSRNGETALSAMADLVVRREPHALGMIRMLLSSGPGVNVSPALFESARLALDTVFSCPFIFKSIPLAKRYLSTLDLEEDSQPIWLQAASILVSHGAIWDIDYKQWRRCLEWRHFKFSQKHATHLDMLELKLDLNRTKFFKLFPGAASNEEWSIKDPESSERHSRPILNPLSFILDILQPTGQSSCSSDQSSCSSDQSFYSMDQS